MDLTVFITGATSGIGKATAEFLAKHNYRLILCGRNQDRLKELKQTCMNGDENVFCGKSAKMLLIKKIGNQTPECISQGKDTYKRTLAECFVNGESLSKFLVRSGYAFAYRKYSTKFIKDEEFAKANKLGMWKMTFQYPWDFRKAS